MINQFVEIVFSVGLFANALFFIPQIIKLVKKKSSKDVSLITFLGFNIIQIFTTLHGFLVQDYKLMIGYLLSALTCGAVTVLTIFYRI